MLYIALLWGSLCFRVHACMLLTCPMHLGFKPQLRGCLWVDYSILVSYQCWQLCDLTFTTQPIDYHGDYWDFWPLSAWLMWLKNVHLGPLVHWHMRWPFEILPHGYTIYRFWQTWPHSYQLTHYGHIDLPWEKVIAFMSHEVVLIWSHTRNIEVAPRHSVRHIFYYVVSLILHDSLSPTVGCKWNIQSASQALYLL